MSSLTRARSLRKPAGPTALPPKERPGAAETTNRNVSPSRLPTKPAMRPTTTAATATTAAALARSASGRAHRPGSASSNASSATGPTRSVSLRRKPPAPEQTATAPPAAPPLARKDTHRYPPLSSATRPTSMVLRPTSAGSTTSTSTATRRTTPIHTRANSAAVTTGPATSSTARSAPPAAQERKSRSRPPSRDPSSSSAAAAATPSTPKRRAVSVDKPPRPPTTPTASHAPRLHRPAFNTLQQQRLSPSKTSSPKPSPAQQQQPPPSPSKLPANVAASADTARLQAELLQLHLLHRDAAAVEAQWHASAQAKLGQRFRALRDAHRATVDREAAEAEGENLAALQRWTGGTAGTGTLEERTQALDAVVSGVWALSEPGGKYARVVRRFERWVERVMDLEEARDSGALGMLARARGSNSIGFDSSTGSGSGGMEEALFLQDLDPAWTDDCASMTRRLEEWQDQLGGGPGPAKQGSGSNNSLARMLDGARSLVGDMLAELGAMEEIRQAARAREEAWIEAMNRDDDENDTPPAGAVWRAV